MRVQQGRNPLTLTPDPAGSLLPPPGFPPPFFSYLSLPFGLFVLSPPPLPINSFLRSLTPPSGPSPYPKLPPLASSQNPNVAIAWGPLSRPGGLPSFSLGYSHLPGPPPRTSGLIEKQGSKGQGLGPGSAAAGLGRLVQHLPQTAWDTGKYGSERYASLPPPFSLLGVSDAWRKA